MIDRSRQEVRSKKLELRQHLVAAITDEQRLYQRHTDAVREAERWHQRAKLALGKGLEDLAREALVRANQHSARATDFERQYLEQKSYVERTKSRLRALESGVQPVSQLRPSSNPKVERSLARLEQQEERDRREEAGRRRSRPRPNWNGIPSPRGWLNWNGKTCWSANWPS